MLPAIEKVYHKPDKEPAKKSYPVFSREGEHKNNAGENTSKRHKGNKRGLKGTVRFGMFLSHDEYSTADDNKGEKSADINQFSQ